MTGYLLDTSVLSMLAPGRPDLTPEFQNWLVLRDGDLFVSAVSIAEIGQGIAKLQRTSGGRRVQQLAEWQNRTLTLFADRILDFDREVAQLAGQLADAAQAAGRSPGLADIYIAATALHHDLLLLTRNVRHFSPLGVAVLDPLDRLPD